MIQVVFSKNHVVKKEYVPGQDESDDNGGSDDEEEYEDDEKALGDKGRTTMQAA